MAGRIHIMTYMNQNVNDHVDPLTGEVNHTLLAEDACQHFNDYIGEDEIPEKYFEYAIEVADRYEIKTGVQTPHIRSSVGAFVNSVNSDFTINRIKNE